MSLVQTLMQSLRTEYQGTLDKNEIRASRYGAWDFFQEESARPNGVIDSDMKAKIKASFGNTVVVPVLDNRAVTIGNVRSCTIADDENTSKLVTLTFVTYAFGFTMYPAQYTNNDIKYQADFTTKMKLYTRALATALDNASIAVLEANKNSFWTGIGPYTVTSDALQVPLASQTDYYNQVQQIMDTMDFYSPIHIVSSTSGSPLVRRLAEQGGNNSINEAWQLNDYKFHWTNRIPNGAGVKSTQYLVSEGSVGAETRIDPDARMNSKIGGGQMEWSAVNVPLPNSPNQLEMGHFYREDCSDASAVQSGMSGLTRTKREGHEFSVDVAYVSSYNSAPSTTYRPIVKAELLTT